MIRLRAIFVLTLATSLIGSFSARAGTLDKALLEQSANVLGYLKKNKIQNVGVLPFKVQRGNRQVLYAAAPLATNLPRRIENALIMSMTPDESKAVGIIRDAASQANAAGVGSYSGRQSSFHKLFSIDYELAWQSKPVKADAFVTGIVKNVGKDRRVTQVELQLFRATDWKKNSIHPSQKWTFNVKTDAALAADLGYNFSLSPLVLKRQMPVQQLNEEVVEQIGNEETGQTSDDELQTQQHSPTNVQGFAFELHYNGKKQLLKAMSGGWKEAQSATYTAPPAPPGSKIAAYLTRLEDSGDDKLGIVLTVNGVSTLDLEEGDPIHLRRWIYGPEKKGRKDEYLGFYETSASGELKRQSDGSLMVKPFRVLTSEESALKSPDLGTSAGWIHVYVFGSMEAKPPVDEDEKMMFITTRAMPATKSKKKVSLKQLREQLLKANNLREGSSLITSRSLEGGLILPGLESVPAGSYSEDTLPNPVLLGHLAIRYYEGSTRVIQSTDP